MSGELIDQSNVHPSDVFLNREILQRDPILMTHELYVSYGPHCAVNNVSLGFPRGEITAIIGASGSGKSSFLRGLNRMNELIDGCHTEGEVIFKGTNIYDKSIDPVEVRRRIGMVFQKPNPFPKSIYENVAWGARIHGFKGNMDELVEDSLRQAALWDDVKDKLRQSGLALSGGQQQRLCIARTLAVKPNIILMDEPCSALDPKATYKIENLMQGLSANGYTIIIVTHNMQQASRVSHNTAVFHNEDGKGGTALEYNSSQIIFTKPQHKITDDLVRGKFG